MMQYVYHIPEMYQDRESQAFIPSKKNKANKAPEGGDGHFNPVESGHHLPLCTSWKHLMILPKCMGILSDESQWSWKAWRMELLQECLQLLGYSRSKLERNQIPANRLAKQM